MKKIMLLLISLACLFFVVSCAYDFWEKTENQSASNDEYTLTVNDPNNQLYEKLKASYKAGERVVVKTQLITDTDEFVELNGAKPISVALVKDGNGQYIYNEYVFDMPSKDSVLDIKCKEGMGLGFNVTLNDPNSHIINRVQGLKMAGSTYEINSNRSDIIISINGEPIAENPQEVKNAKGETLYYFWSFKMPKEETTISVLEWATPKTYSLNFELEEKIKELAPLFEEYEKDYFPNEAITISPKQLGEFLDAKIVLKVNGIKITESNYNEWQFTMPNRDTTVEVFLVSTKWAEGYFYLNVEDPDGILYRAYDGYYKAGDTVKVNTKWFEEFFYISISANGYEGFDYDMEELFPEEGCKYKFEFIMPNCDFTLIVKRVQNNSKN